MLKLNHRLKNRGGGNLLKRVVADVLADGNRLFHCGEIKLSQCHSELVSGCQAGCTAKYPLLEERDKVRCLTEQVRNIPDIASKGSLSECIGEFPSPREEGLGERVLPFAMLAVHDIIKKCAFTLAEVLITLGIIGVVAAITIPSLVTKCRVMVLESQFKKADAMFQQALITTFQEVGYDSIRDLEISGSKVNSSDLADLNSKLEEINKVWISQFSGATTITNNRLYSQGVSHVYDILGGKYPNNYYFDAGSRKVYLLKNGMLVTTLRADGGSPPPVYLTFKFDTNGPYKGPNRLGHDIFLYTSVGSSIWWTNMCNPTIQNSANQVGCYAWASKNRNPKDNTSPYWDILFKPKSYWTGK